MGYSLSKKVGCSSVVWHRQRIRFICSYVTDGTAAILIGCLSLVLPNKNPFSGIIAYEHSSLIILNGFILDKWEYHPILTWNQLSKSFPWGVFMLQGAGLAIADAFKVSTRHS
jgi:di/tricarboxylate transporter